MAAAGTGDPLVIDRTVGSNGGRVVVWTGAADKPWNNWTAVPPSRRWSTRRSLIWPAVRPKAWRAIRSSRAIRFLDRTRLTHRQQGRDHQPRWFQG